MGQNHLPTLAPHYKAHDTKADENKLLRAPCAYPRGKTAGYYGAENQNRRATLKVKTEKRVVPVPRARGIQVHEHIGLIFFAGS